MTPTTLFVAGSMIDTSSPALFVWIMRTLDAASGRESSRAKNRLMAVSVLAGEPKVKQREVCGRLRRHRPIRGVGPTVSDPPWKESATCVDIEAFGLSWSTTRPVSYSDA